MAKFWVFRTVNHVVGTRQYKEADHTKQLDKMEEDRAKGQVIDFDLIESGGRESAMTKFRKLTKEAGHGIS